MFLFVLSTDEFSKLEKVYYQYEHEMYRKAYYFLKNKELSMDAVQTSILKLSKHLDKIDEVTSKKSRGYILTTVKHVSLNILRKKSNSNEHLTDDVEMLSAYQEIVEDGNVEEQYLEKEQSSEMLKSLNNINKDYREIIFLRYYQDLSIDEISTLLFISKSNTKVRIHRALNVLKKDKMLNMYYEEGYSCQTN